MTSPNNIILLGNPLLIKQAREVANVDAPYIQQIKKDLLEAMKIHAVPGVAAPQLGFDVCIIAFGFDTRPRFPNAKPAPLIVLVNPGFVALNEQTLSIWEHCLSIPGLTGATRRYRKIRYWGYDLITEQPIEREAEGIHAVLFQHEYDHLHGKLFIHNLRDPKDIGFIEEIKKQRPAEYSEIPET